MIRRFLLAGLTVLAVAACSVFGGADGPNTGKAFAAAYTTLTEVRGAALSLLESGEITPDQAERVQTKLDNVRGALDVAAGRVAVAGDGPRIDEPEDWQRAVVGALTAAAELALCADFATVDFTGCIEGVQP